MCRTKGRISVGPMDGLYVLDQWMDNTYLTNGHIHQMWYKCVSKYGICDINTAVNIKLSFTIAEMSHIQYLRTHI